MKILFISSSIIPSKQANSHQVMRMCQAFAKNGHEVILLSRPGKQSQESKSFSPYEYYGVEDVFQIRSLKPLDIFGHGFYSFGVLCALEVLRISPDLIYGRDLNGTLFSMSFGHPMVFEIHTQAIIDDTRFKLLTNSKNLRYLVVISNALRERISGSVGNSRIVVAHDGADPFPETYPDHPLQTVLKRSQGITVGYIGHLYPGKGGELIVELARKVPEINIHVIGGYSEDIERVRIHAPNNVFFHGHVPPAAVPGLLSHLDIVLLPPSEYVQPYNSTEDIGGVMSPLKMFEYMAAGKAILASDLPVIREVLTNNQNALLAPPGDPQSWVRALKKLILNGSLRRRLGLQAQMDFLEKYTWQKRAEIVLEGIYTDI